MVFCNIKSPEKREELIRELDKLKTELAQLQVTKVMELPFSSRDLFRSASVCVALSHFPPDSFVPIFIIVAKGNVVGIVRHLQLQLTPDVDGCPTCKP